LRRPKPGPQQPDNDPITIWDPPLHCAEPPNQPFRPNLGLEHLPIADYSEDYLVRNFVCASFSAIASASAAGTLTSGCTPVTAQSGSE